MTLPENLQAIVERLCATGQFSNEEAVLRAALVDLERRVKAWEQKRAELKAAIDEGLDGPFEALDMADIRHEVGERLASRQAAE